jgi:hypothetical protein
VGQAGIEVLLAQGVLVQADQHAPAVVEQPAQILELALGALGGRILDEAARVGVERLVGVAQPLGLQLADAHEQPDPAAGVLLLGGQLDLVDLDQAAPLLDRS